jgi:bifunctional ADP-heptose synthase (sugar kinase/adenylyltransferase)
MITNGSEFNYVPAHLRKIADVSGAGDTVISVASLCLALNMSMEQVAVISNLAGGLVCEEVGVIPINIEKLSAEYFELYN